MRHNYAPEPAGQDGIEFLITDVEDAFWLVSLNKRERRYFVISFRGRFYVFLRTAQGSRGAPLSWSCIVSLLARVAQSLFATLVGQDARLLVYVDDPILLLRGTHARRGPLAARFIACSSFSASVLPFQRPNWAAT